MRVERTSLERICCGATIGTSSLGIAFVFEEKIEPPARLLDDRDLSSSAEVSGMRNVENQVMYRQFLTQSHLEWASQRSAVLAKPPQPSSASAALRS